MNVLNVLQLSFVLLVILTLILFTGHFTIKERRRPNWRLCQRSVRPRRKKCWHFWIFCKWDHRRPRLCFLVHSGRRRTTEYCSELVTLRRRKQKKSMAAEENWSSGKTAKLVLVLVLLSSILVESTPQHSNLVTITAEGKKTIWIWILFLFCQVEKWVSCTVD